jgi:chromate transport protein ChrA
VYGYSIEPFNHYIVWPRCVAALLVSAILYELWQDRKTSACALAFACAVLALILGAIGFFFGQRFSDESRLGATVLILGITLLLAQGYAHQIRLILKSGRTGAVDIRMSQFIFLMDLSTMAFALSMGFSTGWPLFVLALVSAVTKLMMMYLFYWVRVSAKAAERRGHWQTKPLDSRQAGAETAINNKPLSE